MVGSIICSAEDSASIDLSRISIWIFSLEGDNSMYQSKNKIKISFVIIDIVLPSSRIIIITGEEDALLSNDSIILKCYNYSLEIK